MALAGAVQGATRPSQLITWTTADNLTGAEITGTITDKRTGITRAIAGALVITDAENKIFRWDYDSADVADASQFTVQFNAAYGNPPSPERSIEAEWTVYEYREVPV